MSVNKEEKTTLKIGQKLNDLIELVCLHHILAVSMSSLPFKPHVDERKQLATLQIKIEALAFEYMKTKKLNQKMKEVDNRSNCAAFKLQCNCFRECMERFRRDLYKLLLLNNSVSSDDKDLLKWDGLNTGFRSFSSLFESCKSLKSQQAKQDNRSSNARMEDISRKITILLKSLVANTSVQVWTIENYSSIDMEIGSSFDHQVASSCLAGILSRLKLNSKVLMTTFALVMVVVVISIILIVLFGV